MIEFGKTLRNAREAKGLSIAQIADSTHMMSQIVEGLENEDFSRIVAPIYGRGFVKLYCEAVGLEPKELIAEFMEIYNGNRAATIRVRDVPKAEEPAEQEASDAAPVSEVPAPRVVEQPSFDEPLADEATSEPTAFQTPATPEPVRQASRVEDDPFFGIPAAEPPKPPVKRSFKMPGMSMPDVPPSLWRMATLVGIVIVVIWAAFIGVRALYRATMTAPETAATSTSEAVQTEKKAVQPSAATTTESAAKKAKRTPMPIPPLYID